MRTVNIAVLRAPLSKIRRILIADAGIRDVRGKRTNFV
jgi:hypothetical protein